ncbi:MAG TPA: PIN domain-containing protein [Woeseiaceae bacterium]|nr:PIN domain-containing protein [Woeseiaceae bacterium]
MSLFVDTSMWYAAADRGDLSNARAKSVLGSDKALVTSDHVLVESWLLLHHRLGRDAAGRFWEGLRGGVARVERVNSADLEAAWAIATAFPDQDFSIVDRTSFAVMERLGVHRAAALDDDFAVYRFGSKRDRAFEVIR